MQSPKPVLKEGTIYISDNGRLICNKCAGATALYTGRGISGQKVDACGEDANAEWKGMFHRPLSCEAGCTHYT